jgi:acyl-CoA dehydrogenase/citronellyl-CoA dehydrogenase
MTTGTRAAPASRSDEHREFRQVCRAFVRDRVLPLTEEAERTRTFPAELWPAMGEAGLLGIGFPEEHGGTGGDTTALAILAEELATASGGMAITPLVSSSMAAPHLVRFGSEALRARYLPEIAAGRSIAAIAVTEPDAGSDVAGIRTAARSDGDEWVLRGTKMFITNGGIADVLVVAARTDPDSRHGGITMFLVERGDAGFHVGRPLSKMGWHASDTRELTFDDCRIPAGRVVGGIGEGFAQIMQAFQTERIVLAAMGVGLARAALEDALAHAKERHAFGAPIASFQVLRHKLAEMAAQVETARVLTLAAAARLDAGPGMDPEVLFAVATAKLVAGRVANRVADDAVQIFGGYGFIEETRVAMHYRDARVLRIGGGTDEIQLEILAKHLGL